MASLGYLARIYAWIRKNHGQLRMSVPMSESKIQFSTFYLLSWTANVLHKCWDWKLWYFFYGFNTSLCKSIGLVLFFVSKFFIFFKKGKFSYFSVDFFYIYNLIFSMFSIFLFLPHFGLFTLFSHFWVTSFIFS